MNILLIGSGGREHALALALVKSHSTKNLYCTPGNPGILSISKRAEVDSENFSDLARFCKHNEISLVVIGPEKPLAYGMADYLRNEGIAVFGPDKLAAQLESSKKFAKEFMLRHNIPTAGYAAFSFTEEKQAHDFIDSMSLPVVLKADGLAAGKGVVIADNYDLAHSTLASFFNGLYNSASKTVVIEEFMSGEEASILAISDGSDYVTLASSQDHKRIYNNDRGPNTGGMGAYSPAPIVSEDVLEKVNSKILKPAIDGMKKEGIPFVGCLYAGLMIQNREPKVVEFNVRFGDPETQSVLAVFEGDFAGLLHSAAIGELDESFIHSFCSGNACCVIIASDGYPEKFLKGFEITGIEQAESSGATVFHAGTAISDGKLVTAGGRVLCITGKGAYLKEAIDHAYNAVEKIHFENIYFRNDIGEKGIKNFKFTI